MERETGIEPATNSLEGCDSTIELLPPAASFYKMLIIDASCVKHPPPKPLLEFLKPYDVSTRDLALEVRATVLSVLAPCHECMYDAYNAVAIGYGPTDRLRDGICHVAVYARHVNLGFNRGTELDDPDRLLEGTGKRVRHITIKSREDLRALPLRKYLREARAIASDNIPSQPKPKCVVSVVKAVYPTRRRPR